MKLLEEMQNRNVQIARSDKPADAPAAVFSGDNEVIEAKIEIG